MKEEYLILILKVFLREGGGEGGVSGLVFINDLIGLLLRKVIISSRSRVIDIKI